jgi:hypothetical protein
MKLAGAAIAAVAAVAAVAVVAGSLFLFGDGGGIGSAQSPTPNPTVLATPTPEPTPAPLPFFPFNAAAYVSWETYTSEMYGTQIGHPGGWTVDPAARAWEFETDAADDLTDAADQFVAPDGTIRLSVWTVSVEGGTTLQEWVKAYCELNTTPCADLDERVEPALREVYDQHRAGVIIEFLDDVQAFMPSWAYDADLDAIWTEPAPAGGGEIIVVASWRPAGDFNSRDLVDGFSLQLSPDPDAP